MSSCSSITQVAYSVNVDHVGIPSFACKSAAGHTEEHAKMVPPFCHCRKLCCFMLFSQLGWVWEVWMSSFWVWDLDTNCLSVCMCKSTSMLCLRRTAADACVVVCLCIDIYIMLSHTILLFISTCRYTCAYYSQSTDMHFGLHRGGVCQMHIFQFQVSFAKNDWRVSCSILYSTFVGSKPFQGCSKFPRGFCCICEVEDDNMATPFIDAHPVASMSSW